MRFTKGSVIATIVAAVVVVAMAYFLGTWWTLAILGGLILLVALLSLAAAKTGPGQRAATALGRRVGRTRIGRRMGHAQLHAQARRAGISLTDPFGRPLSDVELQLELVDTPETRAIKRQLKAMNPQQRAQALRMMEAQAEVAQRTGEAPAAMAAPPRQGMSGRVFRDLNLLDDFLNEIKA